MEVNENVKKFIEENIKLIENYDLGALDVEALSLHTEDKHILYRILRDVENSYTWLQNTTAVPFGFFNSEKVDTIIIPYNIKYVYAYAIYSCDINKMVCEESTDTALVFNSRSIGYSHIKAFITKRDIELRSSPVMMYRMDEFETNSNIIATSASPFVLVYNKNKDIHFTVSKDSMLIYSDGKSPDESLAKHLINIGFKNVTVV